MDPNRNRSKDTRTLPETQASHPLPGILAEIVRTKRRQLDALRPRAADFAAAARAAPATRDFLGALAGGSELSLIAECKRRSPGAGAIRPDLVPEELAASYERAGAQALSVLTDAEYFGGSNDDLAAVRAATSIPILRKDFTLDPVQIVEARATGADAVLLIVRILTDSELRSLLEEARAWSLSALVETHDEAEVERALRAGARIIGINNRDLSNFTTDLGTTLRLLDDLPPEVVVVSESGIRTADDVRALGDAGVDAVLVGETLLRAEDSGAMAASLARVPRRDRFDG
jgi:indole-3-glycerol phosphate synthase